MECKSHWQNCAISLHQGDITALEVDAIVNAANAELLPGGGVCGAIHRGGGPAIAAECAAYLQQRGPVPVGGAVLTTGGKLAAKHVIHAVGPFYSDYSTDQAAQLLRDAYRNSLHVARQKNLRSVAFPCISTGIYGYPPEQACPVALKAVQEDLLAHNQTDRVIFCTFLASDFALYRSHLEKLA